MLFPAQSLLWLGAALYFAFAALLSFIDYRTLHLPDKLTLSLLWLGLLFHTALYPAALPGAIFGAVAGYLSLWTIHWIFFWVTNRQGIGYGDFKLLAAVGAWNGIAALPRVVTLASLAALACFVGLYVAKQYRLSGKIPFGPFLASAGWGEFIWQWLGES